MMLSKFLDPKNDFAFKKIFGTQQHQAILIHFINDILGWTGHHCIQSIEFLSTIHNPEIASKKQSIVDVLVKDGTGTQYIIEMQVAQTKGFEKRAQYYAASAYARQADTGDRYHHLKEIIFIAIADCIIFPDKLDYLSNHMVLDRHTHTHDLKDFYFTFIELPKFDKKPEDSLETIIEKWCYFFKYASQTKEKDLSRIVGADPIIQEAYQALDQFYWSEQELLGYEQEVKRTKDAVAILEYAQDEGERRGKIQGRKEGKAEGLVEGRQAERLEMAQRLLSMGMDPDQVKQITQLTLEQLLSMIAETQAE